MTKTSPDISNVAEYTVSEISAAIKRTMEDTFSFVRVRGEVGRISRPGSGHIYLDLKDERAVLAGVIWRGVAARLKFQPEEGLEVIATGRITTYPGSSKYQIVIEALEPAGVGALMALLEERKRKLAAEGLFDEARKRPLPFLPSIIGVITSPSGAVIRDILHGFDERFPSHVIVWPVRVQGETCAAEVAAAIAGFNALAPGGPVPRPDVLIVARGGGSLEDLWGFNEEIVARAAAASEIPLISAVGHETDWTLIDFVADARAPTPTKAAEWAVPKRADLLSRIAELDARLAHAIRRSLESLRRELKSAARGLPRPQDLLALSRQRFDSVAQRLAGGLGAYAAARRGAFERWAGRLRPGLLRDRLSYARQRLEATDRHRLGAFVLFTARRRAMAENFAARLQVRLLQSATMRARERFDSQGPRLRRAFALGVRNERRRLDAKAQLLGALSHKRVLERGFALVRDASGRMVRRAAQARTLAKVEIEFADGRVPARIGSDQPGAASASSPVNAPPAKPSTNEDAGSARPASRSGQDHSSRGKKQGNLF